MPQDSMQLSFSGHKPFSNAALTTSCTGGYGLVVRRLGPVQVSTTHLSDMSEQSPLPYDGLDPLLTVGELSDYLGIPVATLYDWRTDGIGPKAVKLGRALRYPQSNVRLWIQERADA